MKAHPQYPRSLGLGWNAERQEQQAAHPRFRFERREVQAAAQQRRLSYERVLRGAVGLSATSPHVERDAYSAILYLEPLDWRDRHALERAAPSLSPVSQSAED